MNMLRFSVVFTLLSVLATEMFAEISFDVPSSGNGKQGDRAFGDDGFLPGSEPTDQYTWQRLYNECIETYVSCKDRREGCEICEQLCMVAAGDAELAETRDYLQNMSVACSSGHFMEDDEMEGVGELPNELMRSAFGSFLHSSSM